MPAKYKDPDPLSMEGLDPLIIDAAVDAKKQKPPKPLSDFQVKKEDRLAQKEARLAVATQPKPDVDAPLTADEKSKLLDKLSAYKERFPHLKTRNKTLRTADDINDELHYAEVQLGSQQGSTMGTTLLYASMCALEYSTALYNPLNLNLSGLGEVTKQNMSEFEPIVDELMIKYGGQTYVSPEYRLMLALGATVLTVHTANIGDPTLAHALHKMNDAVKKPANAEGL